MLALPATIVRLIGALHGIPPFAACICVILRAQAVGFRTLSALQCCAAPVRRSQPNSQSLLPHSPGSRAGARGEGGRTASVRAARAGCNRRPSVATRTSGRVFSALSGAEEFAACSAFRPPPILRRRSGPSLHPPRAGRGATSAKGGRAQPLPRARRPLSVAGSLVLSRRPHLWTAGVENSQTIPHRDDTDQTGSRGCTDQSLTSKRCGATHSDCCGDR